MAVLLYYEVMAVGSRSLRLWETLKGFQGFPVPARPGCWIAKAGQPLLLAPCSSLFRSPRITAMTTSSTSAPSRPLSRSEWVSTLPPWRRLLAMLNWRPVYDIEQESERLRIESLESEKRTKLVENEIAQLKLENKRLAELESRMDALLLSADSSSQTPPATGSN